MTADVPRDGEGPPGPSDALPGLRAAPGPPRRRAAATASGPLICVLFVVCGALACLTVLLPAAPGSTPRAVFAVGAAAVALGGLGLLLPWYRLANAWTLVSMPLAFALIALDNYWAVDAYRYSIFFVVAFAWVGLYHRRGTALALAPLAAAAYVAPLLARGEPAWAVWTAGYAVPLFTALGEAVAWKTSNAQRLETRLQRLADHDPLTGLPNRRVFVARAQAALADRRRGEAAVVFVDLDRFKAVNDTYGHHAGDAVLVAVAGVLAASVRAQDVPARLAGDEFAVLVAGPDGEAGARAVAERVAAGLADLRVRIPDDPVGLPVSASIGVAAQRGGRLDDLLSAADRAMYEAKGRPAQPAAEGS